MGIRITWRLKHRFLDSHLQTICFSRPGGGGPKIYFSTSSQMLLPPLLTCGPHFENLCFNSSWIFSSSVFKTSLESWEFSLHCVRENIPHWWFRHEIVLWSYCLRRNCRLMRASICRVGKWGWVSAILILTLMSKPLFLLSW